MGVPETAADEFLIRYYRWARAYAHREAQESFPVLRTIKGPNAGRALGLLETLDKSERQAAVAALVKRFHPKAAELLGEEQIPEDQMWTGRLREAVRNPPLLEKQLWLREAGNPANRRLLAEAVRQELLPILGQRPKPISKNVWCYSSLHAGWTVQTWIDVGGGTSQRLSYSHAIVAGPRVRLQEGISVLSWMGVAGQTVWEPLTPADVGPATSSLAVVCSQFMQALPGLLEGLAPPDGPMTLPIHP